MPTSAYSKFDIFVEDLAKKKHDLHADTLKIYLTSATPSANANALKSQLAEIGGFAGYTSGGHDTQNTVSRTTPTNRAVVTGVDIEITAGATSPSFQYVVLFNEDSASPLDPLIGWWNYGGPLVLNTGEKLTVDFGSNSLFYIE